MQLGHAARATTYAPPPAREPASPAAGVAGRRAREQVVWILAAAGLGFVVAAVFSGALRLERSLFLVPYVLASAAFLDAYRRRHGIDLLRAVSLGWRRGVAGAAVVGAFVVWSVLRQPASPLPKHPALAVAWLGVAYGAVDAIMLSVLPVAATWRALRREGREVSRGRAAATGLLALVASLLVTAAYHVGYVEFRGTALVAPLIGAGVISLGYVLSRSPLAPLLAHVAMHVAAVLHGVDSTQQLPPHG